MPNHAGWNWQSWQSVGAHRYWRLYLTNTPGGGSWLTELELIGLSTRTYGYDSLNRLTSMSSPLDTCLGLTWIYDAWSNRSGQTGTGGICNSDPETVLANNQLSGYNYDAAGNMIWDGQHHYTYDAENRIISVDSGTVQFVYDAQGRRVGKITASGWRDYLYGNGGEVLSEATLSGSTFGWPSGYAYFGRQLLAQYENSTTYFAGHDHLGSTKLMTEVDQTVYDAMDYLPFGEQIAGSWGTTHKFTGKERDGETGLDYFGARYYENALARFMTPDWAEKPIPMPFTDVHDPQTLNRYAYVRNTPLSKTDIDGHCGTPSGLKPGEVGICVASYIASKTVGGIGRGDGRGTNGQGGTSRIETRIVVDPSKHTATKTDEMINRSGMLLKDLGPKGKGTSNVSSTQTDKQGNTYFQVSQDAHSAYSMGGAVFGNIDNHLNLVVTSDKKVGVDPGSSAKDFPSLEVYKYTVDDKGNVTTTLIYNKQESGHVSDLKKSEQPVTPQTPK